MTTWVDSTEGGRARGVRGLLRAWFEVVVHPRRFFRVGIAPGDQAPGLVFAVVVALGFAGTRVAVEPGLVPAVFGGRAGSVVVALAAVGLLVAPATLHFAAAIQTVLIVLVSVRVRETLRAIRRGDGWLVTADRGGVSETVQVIAYAAAPCLLAGVPIPEVRAACAIYGAYLLVVGLETVHGRSTTRTVLAAALPGSLVFGYGFGGFGAIVTLLARWYVI
ncbi:YIP1 family protein [Halobaculum sp. MBLA0147]|uniref:YIP1 family protein n=1 Tax=Halobaculum sp. MBLA0147 TaxID=3079934 RepID=UPI003526808D